MENDVMEPLEGSPVVEDLNREDFGEDFIWGVSSSAYQVEGGFSDDGKGPSIWDTFTSRRRVVAKNQHARVACDFYNRFREDLHLMRYLNIPNFRFSISWPRVMPTGRKPVNQAGMDYYDRLIDLSLELGIEPWVTLYHWDLPQELENKGGWTNREIINWFSDYVELCVHRFGDRVKHWMVLNEPMVFVGAGYFLGIHAPGRKGLKNFLPALHHAALCQAEGGRIIRSLDSDAEVGTTFSCSLIEPYRKTARDRMAARRVDALFNRLFIEPSLGMGYPTKELKILERLERYFVPGDEYRLVFDFDFVGIQNYTREIVRHSYLSPMLNARLVQAKKRKVPTTAMKWEIYPPSIYSMVSKFDRYPGVRKIYITENGAAFHDHLTNGKVYDNQRTEFLKNHLNQVLKAKQQNSKIKGYFVWTFLDNFEWAEGYHPRFGLVYTDFQSQKRIVKSSGYWYKKFLGQDSF